MPSVTLKCSCCGAQQFYQSSFKGKMGMYQIAEHAMRAGWSGSFVTGEGTCSDECRALKAKDVTPEVPALASN